MFTRWLLNLATVHHTQDPELIEKIGRFRYDVYINEFNYASHPTADHDRQVILDSNDFDSNVHHFYTGKPDEMMSVFKFRVFNAGDVPTDFENKFSLHTFPEYKSLNIAEVSRMMIRKTLRGQALYASMVYQGFEFLAENYKTDLVFLYCLPGLVRHYLGQGCRTYGAEIDGLQQMVPLVIVMSDAAHFKKTGAIVKSVCTKHYGAGKNRVLDHKALAPLFDPKKQQVDFRRREVINRLEVLATKDPRPLVLQKLGSKQRGLLARSGFVISTRAETLITTQQIYDREVYIVLAGDFVAMANGKYLCNYEAGDVFGVESFFASDGLRGACVRAVSDGQLLVLRRQFLNELTAKDSGAGLQITKNLAEALAERLRLEFQRSSLTETLASHLMQREFDSLTQTRAFVYWQERLEDEVSRANRYGRALAVGCVHLKSMPAFIDECGEQVSFAVLGRVGEFINQVVRTNDVVSRYSEHSFVILFPETSPEDAWVAIHKLEAAIKEQTIQTPDKTLEIGFEPFVTGRTSDDTATISVEDILQSLGDSADAVFMGDDAHNPEA